MLHPQELTPEIIGSYEFEDRETNSRLNLDITRDALKTYRERLRFWIDDLEEEVIDSRATYLLINTDWHIKREIMSSTEVPKNIGGFMSISNPLGLLGLITIPIIIGLHLLLERKKRVVVSSMFLWGFLEDKFEGEKT